ncbi:MAG TPA: hypothetical protein VNN74_00405 [Candidatus Micrarchaeia archaeon]|nr:hypothetical protein [Candidatus Micrarchaeia archaeon]
MSAVDRAVPPSAAARAGGRRAARVLLALAFAGLVPALAGAAGSGAARDRVAVARAAVTTAHGRAWRGHGTLAFVTGGQLGLLDRAGGLHMAKGRGIVSQPAVSPTGGWVAYLRQGRAPGATPYAPPPPALWAVRPDGSADHRVAADVATFAWSPTGQRLAYVTEAGLGSVYLAPTPEAPPFLVTTGSAVRLELGGIAWSPTGSRLAVAVGFPGPAGGPPTGGLATLSARAGAVPHVLYRERGNGVELAGWWPSGRGLLFWLDPQNSQSIAADGLPLESLPRSGGTPHRLVVMLAHPSWLAWSPDRTTLAIGAGGDRTIWAGGKAIVLCSMPAASCHPLPQPAGVISYQPTWTAAGALAFVRARATGPFAPDQADVSAGRVRAWDATQAIWVAHRDGSSARELRIAGTGALRPRWSGSALLYVHADALWLVARPGARPVAVAGPLTSPEPFVSGGFPDVYDGYQGWAQLYSWGR